MKKSRFWDSLASPQPARIFLDEPHVNTAIDSAVQKQNAKMAAERVCLGCKKSLSEHAVSQTVEVVYTRSDETEPAQ